MRRACGWLTDEPLIVVPGASSTFMLAFGGRDAVLESRTGYKLLWRVSHASRVVPTNGRLRSWQVVTETYIYELHLAGGGELLSYHWHPQGTSGITWPHAHFHTLTAPVDLSRMHFPTGRIALESIVRYAIMELKVPIRTPRGQSRPRESTVLAQLATAIQTFEEESSRSGGNAPHDP
jgi:hypothetical protein